MSTDEFVISATFKAGSIVFKDGGLRSNLRNGHDKTIRAAYTTAQRSAPDVENYMRSEAPWTDRTGNARNGLSARAFQEGDNIGIDLYHGVSYGVWLEVRWNGRYAIINPTIEVMGPVVMRRYERLLERI